MYVLCTHQGDANEYINIPLFYRRLKTSLNYPHLPPDLVAMINPQWLKLPMSRTNGHKIFRPLKFNCIWLLQQYFSYIRLMRKHSPVVQNITKLLANVRLKFLSINMANTLIFFAEKMWIAFAVQKLLTFLQQKYQCIWKYLSHNS